MPQAKRRHVRTHRDSRSHPVARARDAGPPVLPGAERWFAGRSFKDAGKKLGLTQAGAAGRLGLCRTWVATIEGGELRLDLLHFVNLSGAYGLRARDVIHVRDGVGERGKAASRGAFPLPRRERMDPAAAAGRHRVWTGGGLPEGMGRSGNADNNPGGGVRLADIAPDLPGLTTLSESLDPALARGGPVLTSSS